MTIAKAIREILSETGQSVLRDPRRFRALMQDRCFDSPKGELHITCVLLTENHVERLRMESVSITERARIQGALHDNFGFDREVISRAIANWTTVLGSGALHQVGAGLEEPESVAQDAISLNAKGCHGDAEALLRQALSLHCSSALLHATLAEVLAAQNRLGDAISTIKRARELDPDNVDYVVYEGKLSLQHRTNSKSQIL